MPHLRERFILKTILAKLKFAPIFALQGARQTGKSYLAREIIAKRSKRSKYITFDQKSVRSFASRSPDTFIENNLDFLPFIIDEAQKVPDIFDALKYQVDKQRTPGQFFILGSTEFSKLTKIRESLTGRMSRARLYPLTIRESLSLKPSKNSDEFYLTLKPAVSRREFLRYLKHGGMPGIFTGKNDIERTELLKDWAALTTERDIHMIEKLNLSSELAMEILEKIATLEEATFANIARHIRSDRRLLEKHLLALKALFAINTLPAHPSGTGKDMFFILDPALADVLGASFEKVLYTTALCELLAKQSYFDKSNKKLFYYRSTKGSLVHFVQEKPNGLLSLLKIIFNEKYDERDFEVLKAYKKHHGDKVKLFAIAPTEGLGKRELVKVYNWESIA